MSLYFEHVQKQFPEVFCKKGVLRNFTKFTGKHLRQNVLSFFFWNLLKLFLALNDPEGVKY